MVNIMASCEFWSPINLETSFSLTIVSHRMYSTMELFEPHTDGHSFIEWVVYNSDEEPEFVEHIGLWWDTTTNQLMDYDGVFEIPREALELVRSIGIGLEYFEQELNMPLNEEFKLTTNK